jgi:DNA-binding transcriptional MerR regulator
MHEFSINDLERMSGIKAHTLRMWEQRYGLALPQRRQSRHRFYTNEDLQQILRIAWLYHQGLKISQLAQMSADEQKQLLQKDIDGGIYPSKTIGQLMQAGEQLDALVFEQLLDTTIVQLGLEQAVVTVFYPLLEKIGLRWMNSDLLPSQEHFSSQLIRQKIIAGIGALPKIDPSVRPVVLFAPEHEHHELPLLFIHYLLQYHGHKVVYFGTNTREPAVLWYCEQRQVAHLHYHHITNFTHANAGEYLAHWCSSIPNVPVVVSGMQVQQIQEVPRNGYVIKSMEQLRNYCRAPFKTVAPAMH